MDNSDQLMKELYIHVQRILEHHDPKQPYQQFLNVTDKQGDLVNALTRFVDQRIEEKFNKLVEDLERQGGGPTLR